MELENNKRIDGVKLVKFEEHEDDRGVFCRVYDNREFASKNLNINWVQENYSLSKKRGTIRGIHLQVDGWSECKFVQVLRGVVEDVVVDLRPYSDTFGEWCSRTLSESRHEGLIIPRGCGHAMMSLTDNCLMYYKVDNYYNPNHEVSICWDDVDIGIDWYKICAGVGVVEKIIMSSRDRAGISFKEFKTKYKR